MINKGFSTILDTSRWIAALLVLIHHLRHIVLADFKDVVNKSLLTELVYFMTGLGHEAVMVFFVISGLLVGGISFEKRRVGEAMGISDYFIHRFSRIYIVFIPALLVGYVFDFLGMTFFDTAQIYSNPAQYHTISLNTVIKDNLGFDVILGNLVMLQSISVGVLGSNGPLWSLAYEWWYYCLWALVIGIFHCRGISRWLSVILLIFLVILLPIKLLLWMMIWLLGVAVFYYSRSSLPKPHPGLGLVLLLSALVFSRASAHGFENASIIQKIYVDFVRDFGVGLAYSIVLASCCRFNNALLMEGLHKKLASFSYSLYLVHFAAMLLIISMIRDVFGIKFLQQPNLDSYMYFVLVFIALYFYGYLFSLLTERYTFNLVMLLNRIFVLKKVDKS